MAVPSPPQSPALVAKAVAMDAQGRIPHSSISVSPDFTDSLMNRILSDPPSSRKPRALDPPPHFDSLPVALDSPLRTYNSAIPGLYLTHPGGWIEGGSPPDAEAMEFEEAFMDDFQRTHTKSSAAVLKRRIKEEINRLREELGERMRERSNIVEDNKRVEEEINELEVSRAMERRVEDKMRAQFKQKRGG